MDMNTKGPALARSWRGDQAGRLDHAISGSSAETGADGGTVHHDAIDPTPTDAADLADDAFNQDAEFSEMHWPDQSLILDLNGWLDHRQCDASLMYEDPLLESALEREDCVVAPVYQHPGEAPRSAGPCLASHTEFEYEHLEPIELNSQEPFLQETTGIGDWDTLLNPGYVDLRVESLGRQRGRVDPVFGAIKTLEQLAACWRCSALYQTCDLHNPCGRCSSSDNSTPWQFIGCRRGSLLQNSEPVVLCPTTFVPDQIGRVPVTKDGVFDPLPDIINSIAKVSNTRLQQLLINAVDTQRLIALDILCPRLNILNLPSLGQIEETNEKVLQIIWISLDKPFTKDILGINTVEEFASLLDLATLFESEYGNTSLISKAISCLRHCMDALCIHDADLLTPNAHAQCELGICRLHCLDSLNESIRTYLEEFFEVIMGKEKEKEDKKWWLATFYSFCIQVHVRHALNFVEAQLRIHQKPSAERSSTSTYLHLAVHLFSAVTPAYDPLALDWDILDPPLSICPDPRLWKYHRQARNVLLAMIGKDASTVGSYASLNQAFKVAPNSIGKEPEIPYASGTKRRAKSPPSQDANIFHLETPVVAFDAHLSMDDPSPAITIPARTLAHETKDLWALDERGLPLLPPPRYIKNLGNSGGVRKVRRRSRDSSPASRTSMDYSQSPGAIARNTSSDSLAGLPDGLNRWSLGSHGSMSPESYASDNFLPRDSTPAHRTRSPSIVMASTTSRRSSGTLAEPLLSHLRRLQPRGPSQTVRGFYICECCPKKPKKFATAEELRSHTAEKQYECSFCGKMFKNKNEAERHQNSLHTRRHRWSCSMLHISGYDHAYHESADHPGQADVCGYCGEEFPRSGIGVGSKQLPTEEDWDERLKHLQHVHKFRECNSSKNFFRADHFRQHLKHSHAGTPGKWTSELEETCRVHEEPPGDALH